MKLLSSPRRLGAIRPVLMMKPTGRQRRQSEGAPLRTPTWVPSSSGGPLHEAGCSRTNGILDQVQPTAPFGVCVRRHEEEVIDRSATTGPVVIVVDDDDAAWNQGRPDLSQTHCNGVVPVTVDMGQSDGTRETDRLLEE